MAPILYLNGPTDHGVHCDRLHPPARCRILRSYLFGIAANSSFEIPESQIRGASARCTASHFAIGRKTAPACSVFLKLETGSDYPVLSYDYSFSSQGEVWAQQLNAYFSNGSAKEIELINDSFLILVLKKIAIPATIVLSSFCLIWYLRRRKASQRYAP